MNFDLGNTLNLQGLWNLEMVEMCYSDESSVKAQLDDLQ